jgi:hypothetical protein
MHYRSPDNRKKGTRDMALKVYLSGEIHTDWRERIIDGSKGLDVTSPAP